MKLVTAALTIATLLAGTAQAAEITEERCLALHDYAAKAMEARQLDVEAPVVLGTAEGNQLKEHVIRAAYREPLYVTEEYRERAIRQFANMMYLDCLDAGDL